MDWTEHIKYIFLNCFNILLHIILTLKILFLRTKHNTKKKTLPFVLDTYTYNLKSFKTQLIITWSNLYVLIVTGLENFKYVMYSTLHELYYFILQWL